MRLLRRARLLDTAAFKLVFQNGYRLRIGGLTVFILKNQLSYARLGVVVSKKNIRHANRRNYFKRQIREAFRLQQQQFPTIDMVILVTHSMERTDRQWVKNNFIKLWWHLMQQLKNRRSV